MDIIAINKDQIWWEKTIRFSEKCSWNPGRRLARQMRSKDYSGWEKIFAAVEDDEIVGFCIFEDDGNIPKEIDCHPFINLVFVDEGHRGRRISEKMISYVLKYAKELGYNKVYLKSEHRGLYEKYGFKKIADFVPISGLADQLFEINIE